MGGFNVAPRDIEDVLYSHPGVSTALATGIPHPTGAGEMLMVCVNAKEGCTLDAETLKLHCEASGLPKWQSPEVFVVLEDALPTMGEKLARRALQEREFIRRLLAKQLCDTATKRSASTLGAAVFVQPDSATALFRRLAGDKTSLVLADLEPVFGEEHSSSIIGALGKVPLNGNAMTDLHRWRACLGAMLATQRESWISLLGSLLAEKRVCQ